VEANSTGGQDSRSAVAPSDDDDESTPGHMVSSVASEKIPSDTTGDRSRDPGTSSAVP
jgi:hypothetical protein